MRQLRKRFKKLPRKLEAHINATTNVADLQTWLDNFVDARTLADVGVPLELVGETPLAPLRWLKSTGPVPFARSFARFGMAAAG